MPTTFYLRDGTAGVSGYEPGALDRGDTVMTATVNTVSGGTDIQWTLTAGGTALSFATRPLSAAVTIAGTITVNFWASESNNTANAGGRFKIYRLQANGTKTLIATLTSAVEFTTALTLQTISGTPTSTGFVPGDRIVFEPYITNIGTMGAGRTCDMTFNGATANASGDSFVTLTETILTASPAVTT